jgi:hypothetical protein
MRDIVAISWKSEPGRAYFSDVTEWNYIYLVHLSSMTPWKQKTRSWNLCVTEFTICRIVNSKGPSLTDWHCGSPVWMPDWCLQTKCVYEILRPPTSNDAFPLTRSLTTLGCYQNSKLRCMLLMHTFRDMTSKFIPSILTVHLLSSAACSKQSTYHHFAVEDKVLGGFAKLRKATISFGFSSSSYATPLFSYQ